MVDSLLFFVILAGFYSAWNVGANDAANAIGTSVGSKALTLAKAVIIAAIFEFLGSFFFGSYVTETLSKGIIDPKFFVDIPEHFVLGMLAVLVSTGFWLQIASYFGWPVSTTHTIVGAITGFGFYIGGTDLVEWGKIGKIFLSWIFSPFLGAFAAYLFFRFVIKRVFLSRNPIRTAQLMVPLFLMAIFSIFSSVFFLKNREINLEIFLMVASGVLFLTLISTLLVCGGIKSFFSKKNIFYSFDDISQIHTEVEKIFGRLQVVSACMMAFAHGANDVANAIAPVAAALRVLQNSWTVFSYSTPTWVYLLGSSGIVLGLATWGWKVIETVGKKITELTPTRGFSAEISTAFIVITASYFGLPISSTHTLVGAVVGLGLAQGLESINLKVTRNLVFSWILTVPVGAFLGVFFYRLFLYVYQL